MCLGQSNIYKIKDIFVFPRVILGYKSYNNKKFKI